MNSMDCLDCCGSNDLLLQRKISKEIDKKLKNLKKEDRKEVKLLLLGIGEAGKSTFLKQMKVINENGYSEREKREFIPIIYRNIVFIMQCILRAMERLEVEFQNCQNQTKSIVIQNINFQRIETRNEELLEIIKSLWLDIGLQNCFSQRNKFYTPDSSLYFMSQLERISAEDYTPTEQDVLRARVPSTGISEYSFVMEKVLFRLVDVGGQRGERKKWIHVFGCVTSVIFLASLSEYDQYLLEEESVIRMTESLALFKLIVNHELFKRVSMILFLNKKDIFEEKIMYSNLADYFPQYRGPTRDPEHAAAFLKDLYFQQKTDVDREKFFHFTCATDTENIYKVFLCVKETILKINLEDYNLM